MTNTEIIANWVIILTLSGVTLRRRETKKDENAVTKDTERPIVTDTDKRLVTPSAEQIPNTATRI